MTVVDDLAVLPGWQVDAGTTLTLPCPSGMTEVARAFLNDATTESAIPRPAATVMLLRPGRRGQARGDVEGFMLQRSPRMAFAAGAVVFPGGRVDPGDEQLPPWAGPEPDQWAAWLGCPAPQAASIVTAAVRELFEESGVLLAGDSRGRHVAGCDGPGWAADRERLSGHAASLADVLTERGLVLRSDLLGIRGHWLTPEFEPRRYDTYFFTALVPAGQRADGRTTEAVAHRWAQPAAVLEAAVAGEILLMPPTACSIAQLAACDEIERFALDRLSVERTMFVPTVQRDDSIALTCLLPRALRAAMEAETSKMSSSGCGCRNR